MKNIGFMKNQTGFTLLELIVTIAIAAILVTIALPSFNNTIENSRTTAAANAIVGALSYGRSEAIKLQQSTVVNIGAQGDWTVTVNGEANPRKESETSSGVTTTATNITYLSTGYRALGSAVVTINVDSGHGQRQVQISSSGSARVLK